MSARAVSALEGRAQQQLWNLIRGPMGRDGFTSKDLTVFGSTEEVKVKLSSATRYMQHLSKAGYLQCVRRPKKDAAAVWRLKPGMNTGPRPPMILKVDLVFDQNRASIVGKCEAHEVLP